MYRPRTVLRRILQSSLFRAAGIYGTANLLRQAVPVLLVPVLTRYLTPEDYGTTAVFGVLASVLVPLTGLSMHAAVSRKYFDREEIDLPSYVYHCLCIIAAATALVAAVVWIASGPIASLSEVPRGWLWAAVVVATAQTLINVLLGLLQNAKRAVQFGAIQVGRTAAITLMSVLLVVGFGLGWRGSVSAQVFGACLFTAIALYMLGRAGWMKPRFDRRYARHALSFGLPLVPYTLTAVLAQTVDRLFVTHHEGLAKTGLYALGYQLGALIGLLEDSFNRAFQPWLFEQLKAGAPGSHRRLVLFTYAYFAGILSIALGLGIAAPLILSVVAPERYSGAHVHVVWIAVGFAFSGMYKMVTGYIFFAERTSVLPFLSVAQAAVSIGLNMVLVPRYGAIGAAYSTTAAFFTLFVVGWIMSARVYPMPWLLGGKR